MQQTMERSQKRFPLSDLLPVPIQRFLRYPLLIRDLLKCARKRAMPAQSEVNNLEKLLNVLDVRAFMIIVIGLVYVWSYDWPHPCHVTLHMSCDFTYVMWLTTPMSCDWLPMSCDWPCLSRDWLPMSCDYYICHVTDHTHVMWLMSCDWPHPCCVTDYLCHDWPRLCHMTDHFIVMWPVDHTQFLIITWPHLISHRT